MHVIEGEAMTWFFNTIHMSEINLTDSNFDSEVLKSDIPVLVDFWGPGCAPCMVQAPIINELAPQLAGKVKIGKLNVADNYQTASRYGIMSIPTLIIYKNGNVVDQMIGLQSKDNLLQKLSKI